MKNILAGITIALVLAACGATNVEDEASKRQQLQQYKQEMHELKQKIDALESELSALETQEVVKVKVTELKRQPFEHFIEVTGKVEAEEDVDVSPETAGVIQEVFVKEGQSVRKGQLMARLNTDILERTMDELRVQLDLALTNYERQENLWNQNIGSEMQYLQAKNNKESLEKRIESLKAQIELGELRSPIEGVVDVVYQKKGNIGSPQVPFAKVINIDKMKIYAEVSEFYLTKIARGDTVAVSFPALGRSFDAPINRIGNTIDPNNRTFRVRINLNNPDQFLKPNLVSIVRLRDYLNKEAIVIPTLFIKEDFSGKYTYVVDQQEGKTVAKKIYIETGVTDNNLSEVLTGIEAGTKIISEGFNQVSDGTILQF